MGNILSNLGHPTQQPQGDRRASQVIQERQSATLHFLLGGETQTQLLNIRLFDDQTKRLAFERQPVATKAPFQLSLVRGWS